MIHFFSTLNKDNIIQLYTIKFTFKNLILFHGLRSINLVIKIKVK